MKKLKSKLKVWSGNFRSRIHVFLFRAPTLQYSSAGETLDHHSTIKHLTSVEYLREREGPDCDEFEPGTEVFSEWVFLSGLRFFSHQLGLNVSLIIFIPTHLMLSLEKFFLQIFMGELHLVALLQSKVTFFFQRGKVEKRKMS